MKEHKVYHIHVMGNLDILQGYIGVTGDIKARLRSHRCNGVLLKGDEITILHTGSKEECYALEARLRPLEGMGRNKGIGGYLAAGNIKKGARISPETEIKVGQHLSTKTEFKKGQVPHNKGSGLDYKLTSPEGEVYLVNCLTDFCKAHNLTTANIRKVAKGERNFHKGWKASIITTGRA